MKSSEAVTWPAKNPLPMPCFTRSRHSFQAWLAMVTKRTATAAQPTQSFGSMEIRGEHRQVVPGPKVSTQEICTMKKALLPIILLAAGAAHADFKVDMKM